MLAWTKAANLNIQSQTKTPAGQDRDPLDIESISALTSGGRTLQRCPKD